MPDASSSRNSPSRRTILRDLIVFQVKLWLEGFKDVVLMPLSFGAAVLDVLFRGTTGQGTLYAVMRLGDRFERWVNLYAPLDEQRATPEMESRVHPRKGVHPGRSGDESGVNTVQSE